MGHDADATRTFYDRISHVYDRIADAAEHGAREQGQAMLALAPGETVLEIGYGPGRTLVDFARAVGDAGSVCGIDLSSGMAEQARRRLADEGLSDAVETVVGDARRLPWNAETFDAAFLSFTLELFSDADVAVVLSELRRVLRPGGRLVVVHMRSTDRHGRMERVYEWIHRHFPHFVDCRPIRARDDLETAGFVVERDEQTSIWGLPVGLVAARAGER